MSGAVGKCLLAAALLLAPARAGAEEPVTLASATTAKAAKTVKSDKPAEPAAEPPYDGLQELFDFEARTALGRGDYERAWHYFWRLLKINPDDCRALREAARSAQALGDLAYAERALAKVNRLRRGAPDPELHYLRGEALLGLGRKPEALRELAQAEREITAAPRDRSRSLWLARIYALRGESDRADAVYREWLPEDVRSPEYAEISLYLVEARILADDWAGAEKQARDFLVAQPYHTRGREVLAWVLEARGDLSAELDLRAGLAHGRRPDANRSLSYARVLERSYDFEGALSHYAKARDLGVMHVDPDIERMRLRVAPELGAGASMMSDPSGEVLGLRAGGSLPVWRRLRFGVMGSHDSAEGISGITASAEGASVAAFGAKGSLVTKGGQHFALGGVVHQNTADDVTRIGASAVWRTSARQPVSLDLTGEYAMPWRESASTVREGGVYDQAGADLRSKPLFGKLVLGVGGRARRLGLAQLGPVSEGHAMQLFGLAGADFVLSADHGRTLRGEALDDELLWPAPFANALVLAYRHYELDSDDPFGSRLVLVERSSTDELSGTLRRVFQDGIVGLELRGGLGYDNIRAMRLWRTGGSLLVTASRATRLSFAYDVASESSTGLSGRRHGGWITFHVDL